MPFYTGDWFKCPEVRALPLDYRALWFDLICFMWESTERGVMVKPNGNPYSKEEIVRMIGLDNLNSGDWLTYLVNNNVCSVREDGAIFSRRMVKDEKIRALRKEIGQKGGNPKLLVNQTHKQKVNLITEYENEYENEDVIKNTTKTTKYKVFKKPTVQEVIEFCKTINSTVDAEYFWNYYDQTDWIKANGQKIINWKSTIRTWERKNIKQSQESKTPKGYARL